MRFFGVSSSAWLPTQPVFRSFPSCSATRKRNSDRETHPADVVKIRNHEPSQAPAQQTASQLAAWLHAHPVSFSRAEAESTCISSFMPAKISSWPPAAMERLNDEALIASNLSIMSGLFGPSEIKAQLTDNPALLAADLAGWTSLWASLGLGAAYRRGQMTDRAESLMRCSPIHAYANIAALQKLGMDRKVTLRLFKRFPQIVFLDYYKQFKPALEDLKRMFKSSDEASVTDTASSGGTADKAVRDILSSHPDFLMFIFDQDFRKQVEAKVAFLTARGLDAITIGGIMLRCNGFLAVKLKSTLVPKVELLLKTFKRDQLCSLLKSCPEVLHLSKKELERRLSYLKVVMQGTADEIVDTPVVLQLPVYQILGPSNFYISALQDEEKRKFTTPDGRVRLPKLVSAVNQLVESVRSSSLRAAREDLDSNNEQTVVQPRQDDPRFSPHEFILTMQEWQSGPGLGWKNRASHRAVSIGPWPSSDAPRPASKKPRRSTSSKPKPPKG